MKLIPPTLKSHLDKSADRGLSKSYLIFGQEALLIEECCDAIRRTATEQGFVERIPLTVEAGFDWDNLYDQFQALSLFAARRVIELRMPTGRPGDKGAKSILECLHSQPDDVLLLVICGALDKRTQSSAWFKGLDKQGVVVEAAALKRDMLPKWIEHRLRGLKIQYEPAVVGQLAYFVEGNLLAGAQEIEKLALLSQGQTLTTELVGKAIGDHARYSVYNLIDDCLAGRVKKVLRVVAGLKREGIEPVLVLWALAREARTLYRVKNALDDGRARAQVFRENQIWQSRATLVNAALKRLNSQSLADILSQLTIADQQLKGRSGVFVAGDIWYTLECICLALSGQTTLSARSTTAVAN